MYKVLIVEDELPARELLKLKVDWKSINCEVEYEASDGQEALEKYSLHKPDIIITDIQMPIMDGLEFIRRVREINESQPIIILSCHESFSFAQKAMKLGVSDYIIKDSYKGEEICNIIQSILQSKRSTKDSKTKIIVNEEQSIRHKSIAVKNLIFGSIEADKIVRFIDKYSLDIKSKQHALVYIDIYDRVNPYEIEEQEDVSNIIGLLNGIMVNNSAGEVFYDKRSKFGAILNIDQGMSDKDKLEHIFMICNDLRKTIYKLMNKHVSIGVSKVFNDLSQCNIYYEQSKRALRRKIFVGYGKNIVFTENIASNEMFTDEMLSHKLSRIKKYLNEDKFELISKDINDIYLQDLKGFMQYNYLKHTNWKLLTICMNFCVKKNIEFSHASGLVDLTPWEVIMQIESIEELSNWFIELIDRISLLCSSPQEEDYSYHVGKAVQAINERYKENISLSDLADEFNISASYLARIIKKETGMSMLDCLNKVRIEKAKELILNSDQKMYEISLNSGFTSTQRFYSVFKKYTKLSPKEFKKLN